VRVFVSSTYKDLKAHRAAVDEVLRRMQLEGILMEHFGSRGDEPGPVCEEEILRCDALVGIYAWRYGWTPAPDGPSITECEFDLARRVGKTCLCYIVDDDHPWPPALMDTANAAERLAELKCKVSRLVRSTFTTPDNLAKQVAADIARELRRLDSQTHAPGRRPPGAPAAPEPGHPTEVCEPPPPQDNGEQVGEAATRSDLPHYLKDAARIEEELAELARRIAALQAVGAEAEAEAARRYAVDLEDALTVARDGYMLLDLQLLNFELDGTEWVPCGGLDDVGAGSLPVGVLEDWAKAKARGCFEEFDASLYGEPDEDDDGQPCLIGIGGVLYGRIGNRHHAISFW